MSKVVFSLTASQVLTLRQIGSTGRGSYSDYGAAESLRRKGWVKPGINWRTYSLTKTGRRVLVLAESLQLLPASDKGAAR